MSFGLTINQMKSMFLDRALIEGKIDRATHVVMVRIGAYIRRTARQSIRRPNKKKKGQPGQPPRNRTGLLKYNIYFFWDATRRSVVIGPSYLQGMPRNPTIPQLLEYGGTIRRVSRKSKRSYTAKYPAYPYMRPARDKEIKVLPSLWRNVIR